MHRRLADPRASFGVWLGDPMRAETEMGPIANEPQFEKIVWYVEVARRDGARLVAGGGAPRRDDLARGLFFEPTIFADVRNDMRIAREEVFGPILSLTPFDSDEEAIAVANDTEFDLASGVWTKDLSRAHRVARRNRMDQHVSHARTKHAVRRL